MPIKACADKLTREMEKYGNPPQFPPRFRKSEDPSASTSAKAAPAAAAAAPAKGEPEDKSKSKKGKLAAKSGDSDEYNRSLFQWEIMTSLGIPDEEIVKFADPYHWLDYFPPLGKSDLIKFGASVDWRRSFITTDKNPYYDSFVRWQYTTLRKLGKVDYGKRACVYSIRDGQPCADHDRQSGEGVGAQEFTLIKMKALALPKSLASLEGRNVYLVAGTLRPETMYGQTNCWVSADATYGAYEMAGGDVFICGEWAALNLAYQDKTAQPQATPVPVATVTGLELIGTPLKSPNAPATIYALPFMGIKMDRATGIVTSVPSDAPDDYAGLMDLKNKQPLREKFGVKDEWVLPFNPVPIIDTPGYGNLAAPTICAQMKITSQNDKDNLQKAKDEVYLKGFYEGTMLAGAHAGKKVQEAKPLIRAELLASGDAMLYSEPEKPVMSRSGDKCIVALADQWYIKYGEPEWKKEAFECLEALETFSPETRNGFARTLDWLNQWACSRSFGLGTKLPFDSQFLVESLSDSTIYMAYYTVAHLLHTNFDGSAVGPLRLKPEAVTDAVWDYVLLGTPYDAAAVGGIPKEKLDQMKNEFDYWYGVDLRVSGKDLIPNHLTFFIYAHTAIFPKEKWPKGIRANGHILLNNEKMSKATGNFMTLNDACDKYSTSAMRIALANAGDSLDDANFEDEVANAGILRLHNLMIFAKEVVANKGGRGGPPTTFADKLFANNMNALIAEAHKSYEHFLFREALTKCFFEFTIEKDFYRNLVEVSNDPEGANYDLYRRWVEAQVIMVSPICPHLADHIWRNILGHTTAVWKAGWPQTGEIDALSRRVGSYVEKCGRIFRLKKISFIEQKTKVKKGDPAPAPIEVTKAIISIATTYPDWQKSLVTLAKTSYDATTRTINDVTNLVKSDPMHSGNNFKRAMQFLSALKEDVSERGVEALELTLPFSEEKTMRDVEAYMKSSLGVKEISINLVDVNDPALQNVKDAAKPGAPSIAFE